MADWAKRFAESGLGQREFCRKHGLVLMTLQRWLGRVQGSGLLEVPVAPQFAEVKLAASVGTADSPPRWAAELYRPDGSRLRLAHDVPVALLEQLLRLC